MGFIGFDEFQGKINSEYYSEKGKRIYDDFSTFAFGKGRLAVADAREFFESAKNKSEELRVCEFGVGSGDFAKEFMDELKKLDAKLYERITYFLVDVSEKMLSDAMRNLHGYPVKPIHSDALDFEPRYKFHYIHSNELMSDLPSKLLFRKGKENFEIGFQEKMLASRKYNKKILPLENFPEGYIFPLNVGAIDLSRDWILFSWKGDMQICLIMDLLIFAWLKNRGKSGMSMSAGFMVSR